MRTQFAATAALAALLGLTALASAADFDGDGRDDVAVFRPSNGQWTIRGFTRMYFGTSADTPFAGDFDGDGIAEAAYHRESNGLWKAKGITQFYFGNAGSGDERVAAGAGGQRTYDYVVKPGDADDLVAALESDTYRSVFIPAGTYWVDETINVDNVRRITGEDKLGTLINFIHGLSVNVRIEEHYCTIENICISDGGTVSGDGALYVDADYVTVRNCISVQSSKTGFEYSASADYPSFSNCVAHLSGLAGFGGITTVNSSSLVNCSANNCVYGFVNCRNLANCYVDGSGNTDYGYWYCYQISSSRADDCEVNGFRYCYGLSACAVDGMEETEDGFSHCSFLSACYVSSESVTGDYYNECHYRDPDSCYP